MRTSEIESRLNEIYDEMEDLAAERRELEEELDVRQEAIKRATAHPELIVEVKPGVRVIVRETPSMERIAQQARGKSWDELRELNRTYQAVALEEACPLEEEAA